MSDSDDDLPILELIKKRRQAAAETAKAEAAKRVKTESKTVSSSSSSSSSAKGNTITRQSENAAKPSTQRVASSGNKSTDFYESTKKGLLLQRLLCRWWYAIEWPKKEEIPDPPPGYEALDGFPGVFISTRVRFEKARSPGT